MKQLSMQKARLRQRLHARRLDVGPLAGTIAGADADFNVTGAPSDELGMSVAAGDLNGDGVG